ncbi:DUF3172 domain-containing protein [Crocosphaera watsonii WH 8501]|uniref:DUF3172 domain-containing protein n=6 Tax=Crocosphaera watsonii TaxID=263511 RepID=Q4C9J0_CROWT|nr:MULTISPECIES: DUF3172 domain-containing protein [Crocosphaera]EAM53296.1 conserved hypothetical protein [Crocosphaera watsonii WH 8501]EHJ14789.1 hypothetical protein CWATWH0003_0540 [Crocosphaera watsonii WH 0003]MCH2246684.1 DUF3172 domain-containing protein [Crocosphaera sp.]NQZ65226.1 DUF3172 domain-containing protein [Crocosphaera sp.]CCQ48928.1 conserved hypothetical protein [Crocosphaera watsonii WH 8502]
MARRPPPRYSDRRSNPSPSPSSPSLGSKINYGTIALFGGIFVLGIGVGIGVTSNASFDPQNVASREVIDKSAPNAELCVQYGASSIVTDMRVFITLNPFSVYVTQPQMKPGCVLRRSNMNLLEQKRLITSEQARSCRNRMNTFGFVGSLDSNPKIDCIYPNDAAGNLFLNPPGSVNPRSEGENF